MHKYKLAILFTQPPFGTATSREGLDALLAASAFCQEDEIAICFLHDGVFNLLPNALPDTILQKDHLATFKLIDLYDLNECFACQKSLQERGLAQQELILSNLQIVPQPELFNVLKRAAKVLTF